MKKRLLFTTLIAIHLGLLVPIVTQAADFGFIGFINSTDTELRFVIDITGPNKKEEVKAHRDSRRSINDCRNNDGLKPFEVWVEKRNKKKFPALDQWEKQSLYYYSGGDKKSTKSTHRRCGEVLWITHKDGKYWIKHAPHVKASHLPSEYRHLNDDSDYRHLTFVNQTASEMIFKIDSGVGDRSVEPYSAERQGCIPGKEYSVTVDRKQGGPNPSVHGKISAQCGKTLYLYRSDGSYMISFEKNWKFPPNNAPYIYTSDSFDVSKINACKPYQKGTPTILFAHGLNGSPLVWNIFAKKANDMGWRVLRTVVSKNGSIKKRARMLNAYIMKVNEKCGIPDGSLRVVGHSMGGLDLRYLVHYQLPAAKKIESVYTLATPHQGDNFANLGTGDAIENLKPEFMKNFNYWNPYCDEQKALADMGKPSHRFQIDNRQIYLYAFRFNCDGNDNEGDGVVGWKKQRYGLHYTSSDSLLKGKHAKTITAAACTAELETEQVKVLEIILNDTNQSETCHK